MRHAGARSFDDFYRANASSLRLLATQVAGREADDACQEAWLRMWRFWGSAHEDRLEAWAKQVIRNCCRDDVKVRAGAPAVAGGLADALEAEHVPALDDGPEETVLARADADLVRRHFQRLPAHQRQVLWLREVVGQSYAEIATTLGIPVGTVMSRLHAGRRRLARRLGR